MPAKPAPVDLSLVREFCEIAERHDLVDLDVSYGEFRLRVSRPQALPFPAAAAPAPSPVPAAVAPAGPAPAAEPDTSRFTRVRSPLAGVFYRAPRPGAPPFASEGEEVRVGQTLCIIEAMKLMNEITSDVRARVHRFLVENAQVVEAGQDIMLLEPL